MTWSQYFDKLKGSSARPLLLKALKSCPSSYPKRAVELGSGIGADCLHLLKNEWTVHAVEREQEGLDYLRSQLTPEMNLRFSYQQKSFEDLVELPKSSLVYASLSLPFCSQAGFPRFWKVVESSFADSCVFAANFFGPEDDWVQAGGCTGHTAEDIATLLSAFPKRSVMELKERRPTALGEDKFWHMYTVIAVR